MTISRTLIIGLIAGAAIAPAATFAQERDGLLRDNFWSGPEEVRIDAESRTEIRAERKEVRADAKAEAHAEISGEKRENLIQRLEQRVQHLKLVSEGEGKPFPALAAFKARLEAETGTTSIRAAIKSNPELRAMAVALPAAAITAMSERALTVATQMEAFGAKLDARIDAAADAGASVDEARAAYDRYVDAVADAKVSADAAADIVVDLKNGEGSVEVLADARAKVREAHALLKTARAEIGTILRSLKVEAQAEVS